MDRRRFLHDAALAAAATASAALVGSVAGCAGPTGPTGAATTRPTTTTEASTTTLALDPAAWSALGQSLEGSLVLPTAAAYASAKLVYNLRFTTADPAAIAYCASPTDVQRCVTFARVHGIVPTARSGGHSYGGYSTGSGLVIDVSALNTVAADAAAMSAVIGTGTQLVDVYNQLSVAGLLLPAGSCPTVGIAGLTLGGGIGVVGRQYGLTCDNLTSVDVVVADGRLLTCTAEQNPDLFWASRGGGGGNFGIATSFTFGLHPLPALAIFTINWPWSAAADVLGAWQEWTRTAPDGLWSNCQLQSSGPSGLNVRVNGVFVGTPDALSAVLQPFLDAAGTPSSIFTGPEQYLHAMLVEAGCQDLTVGQCHLAGVSPDGTLDRTEFAATSTYLGAPLSSVGLAAVLQSVENLQSAVPQLGGGLVFDAYGGAINRIAPDATAFVHRHELAALQTSINWAPGASAAVVTAAESWLAQTARTLDPFFGPGAYQNYIDPTLDDWAVAYYGTNLPRLVSVKHRYDPDDIFHFAQSIPPTLPT